MKSHPVRVDDCCIASWLGKPLLGHDIFLFHLSTSSDIFTTFICETCEHLKKEPSIIQHHTPGNPKMNAQHKSLSIFSLFFHVFNYFSFLVTKVSSTSIVNRTFQLEGIISCWQVIQKCLKDSAPLRLFSTQYSYMIRISFSMIHILVFHVLVHFTADMRRNRPR